MSNRESDKSRDGVRRPLTARQFNLIIVALLPVIFFGLFHLLGWRDDTAVISGTSITTNPQATAVRGIVYAMTYFLTIVASPILILAVGIHVVICRGWYVET